MLEHYGATTLFGRSKKVIRCVFHEDRTPSLSVNLAAQLWKCHSCGRAGDAWTLLMEKEGIDFGRAREFATTIALAEAEPGGGGQRLSGGTYARRGKVATQPGDRPSGGHWRPSWRVQ